VPNICAQVTASNVVQYISGFENSDIKVVVRKAESGAKLQVHLVRASSTKLLATHLLWDSLRQLQEEDMGDPEALAVGIERSRELLERLNSILTQRDTEHRARLVEARRNIAVGLADARDVLRMADAMSDGSSKAEVRPAASANESEANRLVEQCKQLQGKLARADEVRQSLEAEIDSFKILGMNNSSPPSHKVQEQRKTIEGLQGQVQQLQLRLMQAEAERGQLMRVASDEATITEVDESMSKSELVGRLSKQADIIRALKKELEKASSQDMRRSGESLASNGAPELQTPRSVLAVEVERLNRLLLGSKEESEVSRMKLEGELIEQKSKHMMIQAELDQAKQKHEMCESEKNDVVADLKASKLKMEQLNLKFGEEMRLAQDHSRLLRQRITTLEATTSAPPEPIPPMPAFMSALPDDPMGIKQLVESIDNELSPPKRGLANRNWDASRAEPQLQPQSQPAGALPNALDANQHGHGQSQESAIESVASSSDGWLESDGLTIVVGKDYTKGNVEDVGAGGAKQPVAAVHAKQAHDTVKMDQDQQVASPRTTLPTHPHPPTHPPTHPHTHTPPFWTTRSGVLPITSAAQSFRLQFSPMPDGNCCQPGIDSMSVVSIDSRLKLFQP
jgi:hypothetical protein